MGSVTNGAHVPQTAPRPPRHRMREHVMSIVVTAASGQLGRLVVESLLARGVPAADIVATARRPEALADFAALGVVTRYADHDDTASLPNAFAGAEKLLLISGNAPGARLAQHRNVIDAARAAGV